MHYEARGRFSKQAHVAVPDGTYEEEHGREGFFGPVSHLYHNHPPTNWTRIEGELRPRAYYGAQLEASAGIAHPFAARQKLLYNDDVSLSIWRFQKASDAFHRNADGDELFFVHAGEGVLQTEYGELPYSKGDYLVVPRGTTARFQPASSETFLLCIETNGSALREPDRGILGQHALYDQAVITTPNLKPVKADQSEYEVIVKHEQRERAYTSYFYDTHPLDIAGWKGTLYPWKLNVYDICPVGSHRAHLPPSVHTTFVGQHFVVCSFVPRPLEIATGAQRVPFFHRNIDFDEVLFYHDGDFFSRDGVEAGMITFHPQGFHHGPHATAMQASWSKAETDEVAVMLDTRRPLKIHENAKAIEDVDYWQSWQRAEEKIKGNHS